MRREGRDQPHEFRVDLVVTPLQFREVTVVSGSRFVRQAMFGWFTDMAPTQNAVLQEVPAEQPDAAVIRRRRNRIAVALGLGCGLRQGAVFGLGPEDVDYARGVLRVRRQVQSVNGKLYFALPKGAKTHHARSLRSLHA
ncbi:hypothetical protein [Streptomyces sp. NPDC102462]|uniref:hypothetical protein n=1 Tax=Streptomyces sp. NPDC102462 TaxID=3366178 RepID=UPI00380000A1